MNLLRVYISITDPVVNALQKQTEVVSSIKNAKNSGRGSLKFTRDMIAPVSTFWCCTGLYNAVQDSTVPCWYVRWPDLQSSRGIRYVWMYDMEAWGVGHVWVFTPSAAGDRCVILHVPIPTAKDVQVLIKNI